MTSLVDYARQKHPTHNKRHAEIFLRAFRIFRLYSPNTLFLSEAVTYACVPFPFYFCFACDRFFEVEVEMRCITQIEVRTCADFPPAAAEVTADVYASRTIGECAFYFACEVLEVRCFEVDVAFVYRFACHDACTCYEAVCAVHVYVVSVLRCKCYIINCAVREL